MNLIIQYGLLGLVLGLGLGLGFILYCKIWCPLALPYMCPQPNEGSSLSYVCRPGSQPDACKNMVHSRATPPVVDKTSGVKAPLSAPWILAPYSGFLAILCSLYTVESSFFWYDGALG